jgi:Fe-S cluster assembly ATP-binding protein
MSQSRTMLPCHLSPMLKVANLQASIDGTEILHGLTLQADFGEIHAIMGPNGSGKSTLAHVLAGHPSYEATGGEIIFEGKNVLEMEPEERAAAGIFLAFQYPASIPGVSIAHFLRLALNAQQKVRGETLTSLTDFIKLLRVHMKTLDIPMSFAERSVNEGFSGGEKKRLEMLQMLVLQPRLVILDEIDSGLDIDAIKIVAAAVNTLDRKKTIILIITHYQRILNYITPDVVHIVQSGAVQKTAGPELAHELEKSGYAGV